MVLSQIRTILGKGKYHPLNNITVSHKQLLANYNYLSSMNPNIQIAPVLKSNAYGHGLILVAKALDDAGAPFFCVDSLYEAYELLKAKIKTQVLIMGFIDPRSLQVKKLPFSYAIYDTTLLDSISRYQPDAGIHIFVDTGMHREGIAIDDLPFLLQTIKEYPSLRVEGLMSHFAIGNAPSHPVTLLQYKTFQKTRSMFIARNIAPTWEHIAASDALISMAKKKNIDMGNMARVGLSLYGIGGNKNAKLKPVLTFTTRIAQIKKINKGESVGYDATYTAKKDGVIGILPVGYHDGVDRRLSNKGSVLIDRVPCPIIGRVSMNITTVDISKVKNSFIGQEVVIYSADPQDPNTIEKAALLCNTIPYELLIHLSPTTRRELS